MLLLFQIQVCGLHLDFKNQVPQHYSLSINETHTEKHLHILKADIFVVIGLIFSFSPYSEILCMLRDSGLQL